jgi:hypothetical protein
MLNRTLAICFSLLILSCKKVQMEQNLIALKNWCFIECYTGSKKLTYEKMGFDTKDSCLESKEITDLTTYYYVNNFGIDLHLIY